MKIVLAFLFCVSVCVNLWLFFRVSNRPAGIDESILDAATKRSEKGDTQSMLFLGLRAMLASAVTARDDPRGQDWDRQARHHILKVSAREDDASFWILIRNAGFAAPDNQYKEAGRLIETLSAGASNATDAASILDFVGMPDEDKETFRQVVGLNLREPTKLLLRRATNGAKGHPAASLRLASYLLSTDKNGNADAVTQLVSDAVVTLEKQGVTWNPFAYEYLAELFKNGYRDVLVADSLRASRYKTLFDQALAADRKRLMNYAK